MSGMKPYSEDLRTRIVAAVEGGMSKSEAARVFNVSLSSVKRYSRLVAQEKPLAPRKGGGRPPKTNAAIASLLEEDVRSRPYAAIWERAGFLRSVSGVRLSVSAVGRLLHRLGFSQKNGVWARASETSFSETGLQVGGLGKAGCRTLGVRGRERDQHLALAAVWMVEGGRAPARQGP